MKRWFWAACLFVLAGAAGAQEAGLGDLGGYTAMRIDKVGLLRGSFDGRIEKMTEGVRITLLSEDPNVEPLPIRARAMFFVWPEDSAQPTAITMKGNVEIQHPEATLTADEAEWDFKKGELVFSGNPVMNSERLKDMHGAEMVIDMEKKTFEVRDVYIKELPIGSPADPALLTEEDVTDWAGWLETLKGQASGEIPSPGRQLTAQLDPKLQTAMSSVPTENLVRQRKDVLDYVNAVIKKPGLYEDAAWEGINLGEETRTLLAKEALEPTEQTRLNRLLLVAAYPQYIKPIRE